MTAITRGPWRVQDHLIEQPSWGGRYIVGLKGLQDDPQWQGKKVGQSFEMAQEAVLIDPATGDARSLKGLIVADADGFLGPNVVEKYGPELSLLIKLTQAKGNSFQVHLPINKSLGDWIPKPEAWFYLAPGLYTFGLKSGTSFDAYSRILHTLDDEMQRLCAEVRAGRRTVDDARAQAQQRIQSLDPYAYVNIVEAQMDDIVDLTAGGIHHSWEQDDARFPDGNLVYEVQLDVPDDKCSMRGFDKGKFADDGSVRLTHVADYLATINQDDAHNDIARHLRKPQVMDEDASSKTERLFRTPYFCTDRLTVRAGKGAAQSAAEGFHHLFVHSGTAAMGDVSLEQGHSYVVPASVGAYDLRAADGEAVLLKTYLPVE